MTKIFTDKHKNMWINRVIWWSWTKTLKIIKVYILTWSRNVMQFKSRTQWDFLELEKAMLPFLQKIKICMRQAKILKNSMMRKD